MILKLKEKKKVDLKISIYLIKKKLKKAPKHINDVMDKYAEEFYDDKKDKEKDDGLSL